MRIVSFSIRRSFAVLTFLSFAFVSSGCDFVEDDAVEAPLLEVEYRVVPLEEGVFTRVHGIFFVDADGQEVTLTKITLPWSYKGDFQTDSRVALEVSQRALGEGYNSAIMQIYRDGELSTEMTADAPRGSGTSVTGYDSDPDGRFMTQ